MGRIMGIDFGLKRTGLSVTDPEQIIVQGLETQETTGVLAFIEGYAKRETIEKIVVGYPFLDGDWGDRGFRKKLDEFIATLRNAFPAIPVMLHDERYTSVQARSLLHQSGLKRQKRQDKALLDRMSAILILQEYLGHI